MGYPSLAGPFHPLAVASSQDVPSEILLGADPVLSVQFSVSLT
jgi:hypothetical protein